MASTPEHIDVETGHMSDPAGNNPFSQFASFSPKAGYEMFESMLNLMRVPSGFAQTAQPLGLMPEMGAPLMSVEELEKRIADLRAIEQWLKLNLSMLQSTIQALEVQRSTLATLRAFSVFAQASVTPPEPAARETTASHTGAAAQRTPDASRRAGESQPGGEAQRDDQTGASGEPGRAAVDPFAFARAFYDAATDAMGGVARADVKSAHEHEAADSDKASAAQEDESLTRAPGDAEPADAAPTQPPGDTAGTAMGLPDASAWWNMLQSQFDQIASLALAPQSVPGASVSNDDIREAVRQTAEGTARRKQATGSKRATGSKQATGSERAARAAPKAAPKAQVPAAKGAAKRSTAAQGARKRAATPAGETGARGGAATPAGENGARGGAATPAKATPAPAVSRKPAGRRAAGAGVSHASPASQSPGHALEWRDEPTDE
jgi:hypothetical protein